MVISGVVVTLGLLAAPLAVAARGGGASITGRLSKRGYTVMVLGYNGRAAISLSESFKIAAPASGVTLQLIDAHGKYAGPVIVGGKGAKVYEGVKAGAKLGRIIVERGYARLAKPLTKQQQKVWLDLGRWAHARNGVPLGNGLNYGLVRISGPHSGPGGLGGDSAHSGVPNALSIDPGGDGVIGALEPAGRQARYLADAAACPLCSQQQQPSGPFAFFSQLGLQLGQTLNADAVGVTTAEIDAMLPQSLNIVGTNVPAGDSVALDCGGTPDPNNTQGWIGGLSYCTRGGTGQLTTTTALANPPSVPFPSCCDPSGDGFGNLRGPDAVGLTGNHWGFFYPHSTSEQIGSGDAFVLNVTSNGIVTQIPATLAFVFNSVPALASYDDGAGDSGTISYPVPTGAPGSLPNNPIPLAPSSSGDVVLSVKLWRPQRKGIPGAGEQAPFMDIGHLLYKVDLYGLAQNVAGAGASFQAAGGCSVASLSTSDPSLSVTNTGGAVSLVDSSADRPANTANLLGFTVDLTKCLSDYGAPGFPVGAQGGVGITVQAPNSGDHASQNIWVKRVR